MLTLTEGQWAALKACGGQNFVEQVADDFLANRPDRMTDPGRAGVIDRMQTAYSYTAGLGMNSSPHLVHFLYIAADAPRFYDDPAIDAWLRKPGQTPEQRFDDLVAAMRRRLETS